MKLNKKNKTFIGFLVLAIVIGFIIIQKQDTDQRDQALEEALQFIEDNDRKIEEEIAKIDAEYVEPDERVGMVFVLDGEPVKDLESKRINVWRSYEDRSKPIGAHFPDMEVELLMIDTENNYCKVHRERSPIGWLSCDWLTGF